jgi:hypothetical protein
LSPAVWQQELVDRHPELFVRSFRGVRFSPGFPCCCDGWREIVVRLVERVSLAAAGHRILLSQILERHGALRVHWKAECRISGEVDFAISEAVALAEARSMCTCSVCGAAGHPFSSGSWLLTACADHARGTLVPISPSDENAHIVRKPNQTTKWCRYDRARDMFVDMPSRGLEDWHQWPT